MYWTCSSCKTKNPENASACGKCGSKTNAPHKFYASWIVGGGVLFFIVYFVGTFIGGTLVAFSVEPTDAEVLSAAKEQGAEAKEYLNLKPDVRDKAKEAAIAKKKSEMSIIVHSVLLWFIPFLAFPFCGVMVGFISEGRTIIEAALASVVGQGVGFVVMRFMYNVDIHFAELVVGVVLGFVLAGAGSYVGEAVQEKRERASLEEEEEEY